MWKDAPKLLRVPATFFLDHADRSPCDTPEQMAKLSEVRGGVAYVMATAEQARNLRSDADFYAKGNVDDCPHLVRSAKATLVAIDRAMARWWE